MAQTNTRSSIQLRNEANELMNSINKSFGKTTVVGEERERIFRMFDNGDQPMPGGWITIDYDREETESHVSMIVTGVSAELDGFHSLTDEEIQEQAVEMARLYLENKGRVEFAL